MLEGSVVAVHAKAGSSMEIPTSGGDPTPRGGQRTHLGMRGFSEHRTNIFAHYIPSQDRRLPHWYLECSVHSKWCLRRFGQGYKTASIERSSCPVFHPIADGLNAFQSIGFTANLASASGSLPFFTPNGKAGSLNALDHVETSGEILFYWVNPKTLIVLSQIWYNTGK